jgi:signal peptidase I
VRLIRLLGNIALWLSALLGLMAGGVWTATQAGLVQPLIVISGSMQPEIRTGDLLIGRSMPTSDIEVGDVVSVQSAMTGTLVTHRVVAISAGADGWTVRMKGDDNQDEDLETYVVDDQVLTPWVRVPSGGKVVSKLMEPAVAVPVLVSLLALLGVSLLDGEPRRAIRRTMDRVSGRNPKLDELDRELAAVGVDVSILQDMDDLDLALFAVGVDVGALDPKPEPQPEREPALTG